MATVHDDDLPSPIEVWVWQRRIEVKCRIVHEDETTEEPQVDSLSLRGGMREITGWLLSLGYEAVGRWELSDSETEAPEYLRRFRARR